MANKILGLIVIFSTIVSFAAAQQCTNTGQGSPCPLDRPWCTQRGSFTSFCSACSRTIQYGGGSCQCDPSISYCSSSNGAIGTCQLYTLVGKACGADSDCVTKTSNSFFGTVTEESIYCVNNTCQPCSPSVWAEFSFGGPSGIITCGGFDSTISNRLQRYATVNTRPGTAYTCRSDGMIIMINNTIDYGYQFPGPDYNAWGPSVGNGVGVSTSTAAALAVTTSTSSVAAATTTAVQVHSATSSAGSTSTTKSKTSLFSGGESQHACAALLIVLGALATCL